MMMVVVVNSYSDHPCLFFGPPVASSLLAAPGAWMWGETKKHLKRDGSIGKTSSEMIATY